MASFTLNEQQLLQACSVLFGPNINLSRPFLHYIELSGVKSAYRNRVKETHPDARVTAPANPPEHDFFQVQESYRQLCQFLAGRAVAPRLSATAKPASPTVHPAPYRRPTQPQSSIRRDASSLPPRRMLLGEFLCYSGYCSWGEIHQALTWQRQSRPRLGEIGCNFGWLEQQDIFTIFRALQRGQHFGDTAVSLGLLSRDQVEQLLRHQRVRQSKLGQFFLRNNLLSSQQLQTILWNLSKHNFLVRQ